MKIKTRIQRGWPWLVLRWRVHQAGPARLLETSSPATGLERCNTVYINLDHRTDRRSELEAQFKNVELTDYTRFSAIRHANGALGCAKSHHTVLEEWTPQPEHLLMICEDDCVFSVDRAQLDQLVEAFFRDDRLDFLCLGYNARIYCSFSDDFLVSSDTQTTSCYLVKPRMKEALTQSMLESIHKLESGLPDKVAAIDVVWKTLQKQFFFALPKKKAVFQASSFSDIQLEDVNYHK